MGLKRRAGRLIWAQRRPATCRGRLRLDRATRHGSEEKAADVFFSPRRLGGVSPGRSSARHGLSYNRGEVVRSAVVATSVRRMRLSRSLDLLSGARLAAHSVANKGDPPRPARRLRSTPSVVFCEEEDRATCLDPGSLDEPVHAVDVGAASEASAVLGAWFPIKNAARRFTGPDELS